MFAVIFTVEPKPERWNDYLDLAKFLKSKLRRSTGSSTTTDCASAARRRGVILPAVTRRRDVVSATPRYGMIGPAARRASVPIPKFA
jgi:hypothetical protein